MGCNYLCRYRCWLLPAPRLSPGIDVEGGRRFASWAGGVAGQRKCAHCPAISGPRRAQPAFHRSRSSRALIVSGWAGAQDGLALGDHLFEDGDGVVCTPRLVVRGGEVGAGPDRVRRGAAHRIGVGNASEREILVARDRWARSRRSASVAQGLAPLAGFVTAVAVVLGGPARAVAAPVAPATARPPDVAAFIPAGYRVTAVVKVNLDGAAVDEEAITAVGTAPPQRLVPTTVVLIAWDSYALRWTSVFDAAQQSSYQTESQMGQKGPGLIAPEQPGPQVAITSHGMV